MSDFDWRTEADRIQQRYTAPRAPAAPPVEQQSNQNSGEPLIQDQQSYDALDAGAIYRLPDGRRRRKAGGPEPGTTGARLPDTGTIPVPQPNPIVGGGSANVEDHDRGVLGTVADYASDAGNLIWRQGVVGGAQQIPRAVAGLSAGLTHAPIEQPAWDALDRLERATTPEERAQIGEELSRTLPTWGVSLGQGAVNAINNGRNPQQVVAATREVLRRRNAEREAADRDPRQHPANRIAEDIEPYTRFTPRTGMPRYVQDVIGGLGSTAVPAAGAVLGGTLLGGPVGAVIGGMAAGAMMGSGEATERALNFGTTPEQRATPEQIRRAAQLGLGPGAIDGLVDTAMVALRIPTVAGRTLLQQFGYRIFLTAAIEGGTEAVQEALQNLISQHVYNPEQGIWENVPYSGAVGGGTGAIFGAISGVGGRARARREERERAAQEAARARETGPGPQMPPMGTEPASGPRMPELPAPPVTTAPVPGDLRQDVEPDTVGGPAPANRGETQEPAPAPASMEQPAPEPRPQAPPAAAQQLTGGLSPEIAEAIAILRASRMNPALIDSMTPRALMRAAIDAKEQGVTVTPEQIAAVIQERANAPAQPAQPQSAPQGAVPAPQPTGRGGPVDAANGAGAVAPPSPPAGAVAPPPGPPGAAGGGPVAPQPPAQAVPPAPVGPSPAPGNVGGDAVQPTQLPPLAPEDADAIRQAFRPRPRPAAPVGPQRLLRAIATSGGIRPTPVEMAELRQLGIYPGAPGVPPGLFSLRGQNLDYIRESMAERGFLPPDSTPADLLRLIDEDFRGNPQIAQGFEQEYADQQAARGGGKAIEEQNAAVLDGARQEIAEELASYGTPITAIPPDLIDRAAVLVASGETVSDALERAAFEADDAAPAVAGGIPDWVQTQPPEGWNETDNGPAPAARPDQPGPPRQGDGPSAAPTPSRPPQHVGGTGEDVGQGDGRPPRSPEGAESAPGPAPARPDAPAQAQGAVEPGTTLNTPKTNLYWSSVNEWIDAAEEIHSRKISRGRYEQEEAHWATLPLNWLKVESDVGALKRFVNLINQGGTAPAWSKAPRGARGGTKWETANQFARNRIAQLEGTTQGRPQPTVEQTPAGAQTVLPGAEKAPDADLAQMGANAPLKPKAPQQPADEGLFGDSQNQTDLLDLTSKPEPQADEREQKIKALSERIQRFASGMSRPTELNAGSRAWGGMQTRGIGVDIGQLSDRAMDDLAQRAIDQRTAFFVDSGAFSLFRKNLRNQIKADKEAEGLFGEAGEKVSFESMDFDRLFQRYDTLLQKIEDYNEAEERDYPRPMIVMPDIVGDQRGSLDLLREHQKQIQAEIRANVSRPVVPIQKGELTLAQAYQEAVDILGSDNFIVGIPSNEKAVTTAELRAFLDEVKPARIHFLGAASEKNLKPKLEAVVDAGYDPEHISADANILRSALYGQQQQGTTRGEAVTQTLIDKGGPEFEEQSGGHPLAAAFAKHLRTEGFKSIVDARRFAKEQGHGDLDPKAIEEHLEHAVVMVARRITSNEPRAAQFDALLELYQRQPKLGTRTSTSMRDQAYSTPIPLAYVASRLAGITSKSWVIEPTAGNGALLIEANPRSTIPNEINSARRANLEAQGFSKTRRMDASSPEFTERMREAAAGPVDVVIANPPFGTTLDENKNTTRYDMGDIQPNYTTGEIDHAISLRTLAAMKDSGRAVLIIGAPNKLATDRNKAYDGKAKREFFKVLYDRYNVVDHFTVAGELYERQGAGWPVDVIVIDGRGKSSRRLPAASPPTILSSWEDVKGKLNGAPSSSNQDAPRPSDGAGVRAPVSPPTAGGSGGGGRNPGTSGVSSPRPGGVRDPGTVRPDGDSGQPGSAAAPDVAAPGPAKPDELGGEREPVGDRPASSPEQRPSGLEAFDDAFDSAIEENFGSKEPSSDWKDPSKPLTVEGVADAIAELTGKRPRDPRPTSEVATSAATNAAGSADDAMAALVQLFGGGKTVGSGPVFDQETYAKARPLFIRAAEKFAAFKNDVGELVRRMVDELRTKFGLTRDGMIAMKEYLRRFVSDVQAGVIDLATGRVKGETAPPGDRRAASVAKQETETDTQVAYTPRATNAEGLGTLVPVALKPDVDAALAAAEEKHGDLTNYVAKELGYEQDAQGIFFIDDKGKKKRPLAAEQIDALALAISNMKEGKGFIIGDQTGVGKGRVNAGIIRWAIKTGRKPIFVTEKPNLYKDMYRDIVNVGLPQDLGRAPNILMTNAAQTVPLDDEGTVTLKTPEAQKHNQTLLAAARNGAKEHDVIFTTYSQINPAGDNDPPRRAFLANIVPNSVVIFDESHNAGGDGGKGRGSKTGPQNRAEFARALASQAKAVFYSSATYAKRPDVMDLYATTDMRLAVDKQGALGELISRGGVPMQQIVASMLTRVGQYLRRERSYAGIPYEMPSVPVNRETYDGMADGLDLINQFSGEVKEALKEIRAKIREDGGTIGPDGSVGYESADSTTFTSTMHNLIGQMLLSMKAKQAAGRVIDALKRGEKPVLTVANTMESIFTDLANTGETVDADFSAVMTRYLERTRTITIKPPFPKKGEKGRKHYLTDHELGPQGVRAYNKAKSAIRALDLSELPISPIDAMKNEIQKAGYTVGEITGRGTFIDYSGDKPVLRSRPSSETDIKGRNKTIYNFNHNKLDVILLNQAGATGMSIHASEDFSDQRPRVMILAQPEGNIDTHMQMLGRVNRTGQVVLPRYEQLVLDAPAEKRPAAVLAKKMASLSANTTGARKGALSADTSPDFMNEYGGQVALHVLMETPGLTRRLDLDIMDLAEMAPDDAIRKVTGRIPLLSLAQQEEVYSQIEQNYRDLIDQLNATGENNLEAHTLDLEAKVLQSHEVREKRGPSPFEAAVNLQQMEVKRINRPPPYEEVIGRLGIEGVTKENAVDKLDRYEITNRAPHKVATNEAIERFRSYSRATLDEISTAATRQREEARLNEGRARFEGIMAVTSPGTIVRVEGEKGELTGVVARVEQKGKPKNPLALSSWKVTIVSPHGRVTYPMSQLYDGAVPDDESDVGSTIRKAWETSPQQMVDLFRKASEETHETRILATGNILAAYEYLRGRGQIIRFTTEKGDVQEGVLMPRTFEANAYMAAQRQPLSSATAAWQAIVENKTITSMDGLVEVTPNPRGGVWIAISGKKSENRRYVEDATLTAITGDFTKRGGKARVDVASTDASRRAIERLMTLGAAFTEPAAGGQQVNFSASDAATTFKDEAPKGWGQVDPGPAPEPFTAEQEQELRDIARIQGGIKDPSKVFIKDMLLISYFLDFQGRDTMEMPGWGREARWNDTVRGVYTPEDTIYVGADQGFDMARRTMFHEVFHRVQRFFLTDQELALLGANAERLRNLIRAAFPGRASLVDTMSQKELEADGYAAFLTLREQGHVPGIPGFIGRAWERIRRLAREFATSATGREFRNIEDVFTRTAEGAMARRPERYNSPGAYGYQFSANGPPLQRIPQNAIITDAVSDVQMRELRQAVGGTFTKAGIKEAAIIARVEGQDAFYDMQRQQRAVKATGQTLEWTEDVYGHQSQLTNITGEKMRSAQDDIFVPLLKQQTKDGVDVTRLGHLLVAEHAAERKATIAERYEDGSVERQRALDPEDPFGAGMSIPQAEKVIADLKAEGKYDTYQKYAERWRRLAQRALRIRRDANLITDEDYQRYVDRWENYVPLKGFEDVDSRDVDPYFRTGRGLDIRGKEFQGATGRESMAENPIVHIVSQFNEAIVRGEKNKVLQALEEFLENHPSPGFAEIIDKKPRKRTVGKDGMVHEVPDAAYLNDPQVMAVKHDGHVTYIRIHHRRAADAFRNMGPEQISGLLKASAFMVRAMSGLNTAKNIEWFIPNVLRDIQEASLNLQAVAPEKLKVSRMEVLANLKTSYQAAWAGLAPADSKRRQGKGLIRGALGIQGNTDPALVKEFDEFRKAGGMTSFIRPLDLFTIRDEIETVISETANPNAWNMTKKGARASIHAIEFFGTTFEAMTRFAVYRMVKGKLIEMGMDREEAIYHAARAGAEATINFSRQGKRGKEMKALYMFLNAGIQGTQRGISTLKNSKTARNIVIGAGIAGVIAALLPLMGDDDDREDYRRIEEHVKSRNLVLMIPRFISRALGMSDGSYLRIPIAHTLRPFVNIGREATEIALHNRNAGEAGISVGMSMLEAFNPAMGDQIMRNPWLMLVPSPIRPIVEVGTNQNWLGRPIVYRSREQQSAPASTLVSPGASTISRAIATGLNRLGQGTDFVRPYRGFNWSPNEIDHVFFGYTGGFGRFVANVTSSLWNWGAGVENQPERLPMARQFYGNALSSGTIARQYNEVAQRAREANENLTRAQRARSQDDVRYVRERFGTELRLYQGSQGAFSQLSRLRRQMDVVIADRALDRAERSARMRAIEEQMTALRRQVIDRARSMGIH